MQTQNNIPSEAKKQVLVIGAGAVGTLYAYYLSKQCNVSFLVKPKYLPNVEQGMHIQHLNKDKKGTRLIEFNDYQCLTNDSINASMHWDLIILSIPSSAIGSIDFERISTKTATVLLLSPGQQDKAELVNNMVPESQIVSGMISLISYQGDLSQQTSNHAQSLNQVSDATSNKPHIRYYLPPFSKLLFSGSDEKRVNEVVDVFNRCGLSSKTSDSVFDEIIHPNILLMCIVLGLEKSGWSFKTLRQSPETLKAIKSHILVFSQAVEHQYRIKTPFFFKLLYPWVLRIATRIAPRVMPMPIETYLKFHYSKVSTQTTQHLQECVDLCEEHGIEMDLETLTERLN